MSDDQKRPLPYDLVFADSPIEQDHFPALRTDEEAAGGVNSTAEFLRLTAAERLLDATLPADATGPAAGPGRAPSGASAIALERYGALFFLAYRSWRAGQPVYRFDEPLMRTLLASPPDVQDWTLDEAAPAGYVQLPRNLVFARVAEDAAAEPVDGFFWSVERNRRLEVVLALGVRVGRPGFSVVTAAAEPDESGHFANAPGRDDGADFENVLPGGELGGLHALITTSEALRFASLCLWYVAVHPAAVGAPDGGIRRVHPADG